MSVIHHACFGFFDRRLYAGLCADSSRSSRTCASSGCAHSTWSTRTASATISRSRRRVSLAVKYCRTRRRRSFAVPTYSTSSPGPRNRYTPGVDGSSAAIDRLRRCSGVTSGM